MKNLIGFIIKHVSLLLFLVLEIAAVFLMATRSKYHNYSVVSTSNVVSGGVLDASNSVFSYFSLATVNENLAIENSELKDEIEQLKSRLSAYVEDSIASDSTMRSVGELTISHIPAKVIGNSVNKLDNFITIDKGSKAGIKPDMGVVCSGGVVGIVTTVSPDFSVVLPIINSQSRISCRLDSSQTMGSLVWNGFSPVFASLEEIPRHVKLSEGETITTSGFSYIFPEGVRVGVVEEVELRESDSFYRIKVRLATSFYSLQYVDVISFPKKEELDLLKSSIPAK